MTKHIRVVGAVITDGERILCAQRGLQGSLPGLWEFPGGKVELDETPEAALEREIREELGCSVRVGAQVTTTTHLYDFGEVTLTTFYCELTDGAPETSEHASLRWLTRQELHSLEWAPADLPAVAQIQLDLS